MEIGRKSPAGKLRRLLPIKFVTLFSNFSGTVIYNLSPNISVRFGVGLMSIPALLTLEMLAPTAVSSLSSDIFLPTTFFVVTSSLRTLRLS